MNILTFDIEEWYIEKEFGADRQIKYDEYDRILGIILDALSDQNITATFFCLGKIAEHFPEIVKKIASHGHEIGCHSHLHSWINKMTHQQFHKDTSHAVSFIEDLTGKKVISYRAPAFSIGESNKWAFEVLANLGIQNDASVFPGTRDFGGFPSFTQQTPTIVKYKDIEIKEFPIPLGTLPVIKKRLAFSGGGYFRLLPFPIIKQMMAKSDYNMCYFHIGDLLTEKSKMLSRQEYEDYFKEAGPLHKRLMRYFKSNIGRSSALNNLLKLIKTFDFCSIEEYNAKNKIEQKLILK